MTKYNSIKIIRPNGNIFIDLNSINYDKQILSNFFLNMSGSFGGLETSERIIK